MIFVTVGNSRQAFPRLLGAVDELAGTGAWGTERVLLQIGHAASFVPRHCAWCGFMAPGEFLAHLQEADVVVTHAGVGTLRQVIALGKTPVVMPRRKCYDELIDDHQLDLTEALASRGLVIPAYEPRDLAGAIEAVRARLAARAGHSHDFPMVAMVAAAIEQLLHPRRDAGEGG